MELMTKAGFESVFIGIESPDEDSLKECGKFQNTNRNLLDSIQKIQNRGLEIQAGFILGFDKDNASVFDRMTAFIQKSGIGTAMVGLLQATPKNYYQRLFNFLKAYHPRTRVGFQFDWSKFSAFLKSVVILGIREKERKYYWKIFFWTIFKRPLLFPAVIKMTIEGFHFRKISEEYLTA